MKYQVFTTEKAEEDLNSIADYLIYKLLAGETALKQIDRIEQAVMSLEEMPERYRIYDKEPWKENGMRVMGVDNYLVFYIMPAKNNPNPAKTPIFPRFMPNSPSPVHPVRTKSPSTEIIENSDVLVACKYCGAFLG